MRNVILVGALLLASGCDLAPDYTAPEVSSGDTYSEPLKSAADAAALEAADHAKWKRVDAKASIEEIAWWRMFNAPALDALEEQAMKDNPTLDVAAARLAAARGLAESSNADLFPTLSVGAGPARQQPSAASVNGSFPSSTPAKTKPYTSYTVQGSLSYELDLFGKNRSNARAGDADAEAENNRYRAARLSLQAEVADRYFAQMGLAKSEQLSARSLEAARALYSMSNAKHVAGAIDDVALAQAEASLAAAEAEYHQLAQQLAVNTHQLALLVGVAPAKFTAPEVTQGAALPEVPAGIPSAVLARRPDIKAAANAMAAANERIGAARAAYFPDISLSAVGGFASTELGDLFKKSNQFWTLGPLGSGSTVLTQTLFAGGALSGNLASRRAEYDQAASSYKATSLQAFGEVEDSLSNLTHANEQLASRAKAFAAQQRAYTVAKLRYDTGDSSRMDALLAERDLLSAERSDVDLRSARYRATVQLVRALGGSWDVTVAPTPPAPTAEETSAQ